MCWTPTACGMRWSSGRTPDTSSTIPVAGCHRAAEPAHRRAARYAWALLSDVGDGLAADPLRRDALDIAEPHVGIKAPFSASRRSCRMRPGPALYDANVISPLFSGSIEGALFLFVILRQHFVTGHTQSSPC